MSKLIRFKDFCYMRQGIKQKDFLQQDIPYLRPIALQKKPQGQALLLLHGFASSPAVYREMLPHLESRYEAIVCPVLPGHGTNIEDFSNVSAKDWIKTAESAYDDLSQQYKKIDVMGLSLGGILACHLANTRPVHHLFLLAPAFYLTINTPLTLLAAKILRWLGIKKIKNRGGNIYAHTQAEITYQQLPLSAIIEVTSLIKTFVYQNPTCPIDVFLGRYDTVVNVKKIAQQLACFSNIKIHWLEQSAHVLPLDSDVEKIVDCIPSSI